MERQIKKTIAILLLVCFLLSITAASASATQEQYDRGFTYGLKQGYKDGIAKCNGIIVKHRVSGPIDYRRGVIDGYNSGLENGMRAAGC